MKTTYEGMNFFLSFWEECVKKGGTSLPDYDRHKTGWWRRIIFFSLHHLSFVRNVRFTKSNEKRKKTQRAWNREHREGRLRTLTEYFLTLYISSLRSLSTLSGGGSPFKKCRKQQETFKEHKNTLTVLHHPKDFKNIYAYPFKKKSLSK